MPLSAADQANLQMVDRLIAEGALWSPALVAAFRATPRHCFLDRVFRFDPKGEGWREIICRDPGPAELQIVYSDEALITHLGRSGRGPPDTPISSSSQPSLMAQMLEDLELSAGQRVLEVGAGTGYNAALLAYVAGPGRVVSVDVDRSVLSEAWDHLRRFAERQVQLKHADGRHGYRELAPYERIMVTAAAADLEPDWLEQLTPGGLLLVPVNFAPGLSFIVVGRTQPPDESGAIFRGRLTRAAYFMPLRAEMETGPADASPFYPSDSGETVPAPWAGWFDRRRPRAWLAFIQSLAFFALLNGLAVACHTLSNRRMAYGIRAPDDSLCWLEPQRWHVRGSGRQLAGRLWREFLDAGAPWPTEYDLTLSRNPPAGPDRGFIRRTERWRQCWQIRQTRQRTGWL